RPKKQSGSSRATGACSGHGPQQPKRRATDGFSKAKPAPKSPDPRNRAAAVGRPAPVRGTAPNNPRDANSNGFSKAKPAPKSPDQKHSAPGRTRTSAPGSGDQCSI